MDTSQTMPQNVEADSTQLTDAQQPLVNYSRWMTDNAAAIANMKLHQLALPSAHNAGMDKSQLWGPEELWAACQTKSFGFQLEAGARVLDLRLHDASYRKVEGNHYPTFHFKEVFVFMHGIVKGRKLENCINEVRNFAINNPGEIIILDFHDYNKGNYAHDSVSRCLKYFNPILERLIPPSAQDLTIGEIRAQFPGKNIIIAWAHGNGFWGKLNHSWIGKNSVSENEIVDFCKSMMAEPLTNLWSLSATAYSNSGPVAMNSSHRLWGDTIFKPGHQTGNIINVDFIERTGIVDRCIALNIARSRDKQIPTAPTKLEITQLTEVTEDGGTKTKEAASFKWSGATDNVGIHGYQIYQNDVLFFTKTGSEHECPVLPLPYNYTICAYDIMGNISQPSPVFFSHLEDNIPPTPSERVWLQHPGLHTVTMNWFEASDSSGIVGYLLKKDGVLLDFVQGLEYTIKNLKPTDEFKFEISAKDFNGHYSLSRSTQCLARPVVPRQNEIRTYFYEDNGRYIRLYWTPTPPAESWWHSVTVIVTLDGNIISSNTLHGFTHQFSFTHEMPTDRELTFGIQYATGYETDMEERSEVTLFTTSANAIPLSPPADLKGSLSSSPTSITLTWAPSNDAKLTGYAISCNEEAPVLVPATPCSYTATFDPDSSADYIYEVWAVDANADNGSLPISLKVNFLLPTIPGIPQVTNLGDTSATLAWTPSIGENISYRVYLNTLLVKVVTQPQVDLTHLQSHTLYDIEVRAFNTSGVSEPSVATFKTRLSTPKNLSFSHLGGIGRLTWTPFTDQAVTFEILVNDADINASATGGSFASFRLGDVPAGPLYRMKIRAQKDDVYSEYTVLEETVADWSRPGNPGVPIADNVTETSAIMSWTPSSSTQPLNGYRVSVNGLFLGIVTGTSYRLGSLLAGVYHFFTVRAQDSSGNLSDGIIGAFKTLGDSPQPPPGKPENLRITSQTTDSVSMAWSRGQGEGIPPAYRITSDDELIGGVALTTEKTIPGLTPGLKYTFEVKGYDLYGQISEPAVISVTVGYPPTPNQPRNLRVLKANKYSVEIVWEAPEDTTNFSGYLVTFRTSSGGGGDYRPAQPSLVATLLKANTSYDIKIYAEYNDGISSLPLHGTVMTI